MIRQQAVLDQGRPEITAVLREAALRQEVGGSAAMGAQLGQLAALAGDLPQVTVRVLLFSKQGAIEGRCCRQSAAMHRVSRSP